MMGALTREVSYPEPSAHCAEGIAVQKSRPRWSGQSLGREEAKENEF